MGVTVTAAQRRKRRPLAIAAMVAGVTITTAGCGGISSLPLPRPGMMDTGGYRINAVFENALNLPNYALVRVNGAQIGSLESLKAENYTAVAVLRIQEGVELPVGTVAELRSATPLGDVFVALNPPEDAPANTPLIKEGDTLGLEQTKAGATMESVLSAAALMVNGGTVQNLTNIVNGFGRATGDHGKAFGDLIDQTNRTLGKLNSRSEQIKTAMTSTADLAEAIDTRNDKINEVLRDAAPATKVLHDNTNQIADLVVLAGATTRELEKFPSIAGTDTSGRSVIGDLNTIAAAWNDVATAPGTDLYGLNRLLPPVIKATPGSGLSIRTSVDRLILGHIPDIGFRGDLGFHGPKWDDFQKLVGAFKYTLYRLQERIVGKGPDVPQVPVIPDPTVPGLIVPAPQGPAPGPTLDEPVAPAPADQTVTGNAHGVTQQDPGAESAPGVESGETVIAPAHGVAPAQVGPATEPAP
ncbi:MCE family protein [Mycolicibacterium brumae]|uniref:Mammalian cell entry protein n=2 Tax=Mycolicibacterium brumae TaxID=85968 RepID=A0A2G5PDX8_9MYCO|nr:MCE family protein [Mycolicibacterium brumae]PIB76290.1 mammalian cell entry protein [Mycolicibacterium brumae]RWA15791.1 hypothetical protein MBRU_09585 [Mycolicibacterium brumae DSM 44177]